MLRERIFLKKELLRLKEYLKNTEILISLGAPVIFKDANSCNDPRRMYKAKRFDYYFKETDSIV